MSCSNKYCCTKIKNLSVKKQGIDILLNINLHIHCGELTAIIGPNGAGKSTLLKSLISEMKYEGKLEFIDETGSKHLPLIGYVPQKTVATLEDVPLSVLEFIISGIGDFPVWLGASSTKKQIAMESLEKTSSAHLAKRKISDLSGGEMQKVMLATALCPVPNILLLDEPISGIDHKGVSEFWDLINEIRFKNDIAIIIVTHDFGQVKKYANSVVLLDKTILKTALPSEMFESGEFKRCFNV
jgi:zinc transport system ATP-binding protein